MRSLHVLLLFGGLGLASCAQQPQFTTEDLGTSVVERHNKGRTGLALRRQQCRFSVRVSDMLLSFEGTEGTTDRAIFNKCLSMRRGDTLSVYKVTHVKGDYRGPKVSYFARTDSGLKIPLH